jgi:hypothetical protein
VTFVLGGEIRRPSNSLDLQVSGIFPLPAETKNLELMPAPLQTGELTGQILNMNPRPPVDMGRVFIGQENDFHPSPLIF